MSGPLSCTSMIPNGIVAGLEVASEIEARLFQKNMTRVEMVDDLARPSTPSYKEYNEMSPGSVSSIMDRHHSSHYSTAVHPVLLSGESYEAGLRRIGTIGTRVSEKARSLKGVVCGRRRIGVEVFVFFSSVFLLAKRHKWQLALSHSGEHFRNTND